MVQLDSASILPPSRDRQHFPGFYEELDKEFEHENRESQGSGDVEIDADAPPEGMKWVCTGPIKYDTTRAAARHRQPQGGARGRGRDRGVHAGGRPGQRVLARQRALRQRGGLRLRAGRRPPRRVQGDRRRRPDGSGGRRRADARGRLDHVAGRLVRGLPQVGRAARGRAQPRAQGPARGPRPLPHLLGQLARPARLRPAAQGRRRHRPQRQRGLLLDRAGERPPRARVEDLGGRQAARGQDADPGRGHPPHERRSSTRSWWPQRLVRLANVVGRENVLAGTDCGFAQGAFVRRVHPEIQWAKLAVLAEGARLATRELWGAAAAA